MKPRIRKYSGMWWCSGLGVGGLGTTPMDAYVSWQQSIDGMRNAYPQSAHRQLPTWPKWWEVLQ